MGSWRLAKSLTVLRREVNKVAPNRSKQSDGTIGDAAHASRNSDHNPYIKDANGKGVVRAIDITHDPDGGMDAYKLAEHVRQLGKQGDKRIRYIISNRRIASPKRGWAWRRYSGANAHASHTHVSVVEAPLGYDSQASWGLLDQDDTPTPPAAEEDDDMKPADILKFVQPDGYGVFLVNLLTGTAEGIQTNDAINSIAKVFGLNPKPTTVPLSFLDEFRITEGGR